MKKCSTANRSRSKEQVIINSDEACLVSLEDVRKRYGTVPDDFTLCFVCKKPAEFIACVTIDFNQHPILSRHAGPNSDIEFANMDTNSLALELRAQFGTNLELPVCESHCQGSIFN